MADNVAGSDLVHQRRVGLGIGLLANEAVLLQRHLAPVKGIKGRVAHTAGAGPLGVQPGLRPLVAVARRVGEDVRDGLRRANGAKGAGPAGLPRGAAPRRLVGEVDGVALGQEVRRPAGTAVGGGEEVGAGLGGAGDEDDGQRR